MVSVGTVRNSILTDHFPSTVLEPLTRGRNGFLFLNGLGHSTTLSGKSLWLYFSDNTFMRYS